MEISTTGALIGLALAILLIAFKTAPCYALMVGAFIGGLCGGAGAERAVAEMLGGAKDMVPAILRVLGAGVLAGVLIRSGGAQRIALGIIDKLGPRFSLAALVLATALLTLAGVFIDVAVLTVTPVALAVARRCGYSRTGVLFALVGGGKSGNVVSANPNTIIAAENFGAPLPDVMLANLPAALVGIVLTVALAHWLTKRGAGVETPDTVRYEDMPSLRSALAGPVLAVALLFLRPICGIVIDPLVALPVGGLVGAVLMGRGRKIGDFCTYGLLQMSGVCVLLLGTGTLAGIIKASTLKAHILEGMAQAGLSDLLIAPVSGVLMSGATGSTTAGATIASATFASAIVAAGVSTVWGAAMTNAGATVFDHLPHGSFFHVTNGAANVRFGARLKLLPFESLVGLALTAASTLTAWCFM